MQATIVLVINPKDTNAQIAKLGVGLLEMRVDLYDDPSLKFATKQFQLRRKLNIPLLLTVRNDKKEGAKKVMSDVKKWALLESLMPMTDWVDIELSSKLCGKTIALARSLKKKVIVSAHDFKATPNIEALYKKAKLVKADGIKFAFNANNEGDVWRLIDFTFAHKREMIVTMCVGTWGPLSRLLLPDVGSRWVYTFLKNSTAPGQLDIKALTYFSRLTKPNTKGK